MLLEFILLQATRNSGGNSFVPQLILIGGFLLVFYVFMIMPQQRKQKQQQKFRGNHWRLTRQDYCYQPRNSYD
jgi:preprotein translocase subunit YajC